MVNIDHIEDKQPHVSESSIPYSTNYLFSIYNLKEKKFHKGGVYFKGTNSSGLAKYYKSATYAKGIIVEMGDSNYDSYTFEDFVIVEHRVQATGKVIPGEATE